MSLTDILRRSVDDIWSKIFRHPFVIELYRGSLPINKFRFYIIQDYNYLVTIYKCLSLIAAKSDPDIAEKALEIAYIDASTEMMNYRELINRLGLSMDEVLSTEPSPTNEAYMNFLIRVCALNDPVEGLTSLLPCFWSYMEIADVNRALLEENDVDLYREWCQVYLSSEYRSIVDDLKGLIDRYGVGYDVERLKKIFRLGSRYEYLFWDMAYNLEVWKI